MKTIKVREIMVPYKRNIPFNPSLSIDDKIIYAIEIMLNNNIKDIAVVRKGRPIGMICLKDALQKLGIQVPLER